jgi:hypothetical protein
MADQAKFGILRKVLRTLGLSEVTVNDLIDWISASLAAEQGTTEAAATPHYPYRRRDDFLSPAERNFFGVLHHIVGSNTLICPKVNLADIFYVPSRDSSEHRVYTNKIDRKHVDFVLCDANTLMPKVGIELDDRSHNRADRQERDHFVANVFAAAGLPLVRVQVQRSYAVRELAEILHSYLQTTPPTTAAQVESCETVNVAENIPIYQATIMFETSKEASPPHCPKCGREMLLRTARGGANAGQQFWGCPNYPRCRGIAAYEAVITSA